MSGQVKAVDVRLARVAVRAADFPRDGWPEVCFWGRSNVGKSSLINRLLRRRALARVSKTPGRTQHVHFYALDGRCYLVDLPGAGYARAPEGVRRAARALTAAYLDRRPTLALAVLLVDIRRDPTVLDRELAERLQACGAPLVVVLTKADKVSHSGAALMARRAPVVLGLPADALAAPTSALTGAGLSELSQLIWSVVTASGARSGAETRQR